MNRKLILLVASLILIVGILFVRLRPPTRARNLLAVSRVYIDPQYGYEDPQTGEWKGSYWIVLSTTQTYGEHVFYELNDTEVQKYGENYVDTDELHVEAEVKIQVSVGQPYLKRALTKTPYTLCPPVYGSDTTPFGHFDRKFAEYYVYEAGSWIKKTDGPIAQQDIVLKETSGDWMAVVPLTISATKIDGSGNVVALEHNGQRIVNLEVSGPGALQPLWFRNPSDSSEQFKFKLEGMLQTGLITTLPDMAIFPREDVIFEKSADLLRYLKYGGPKMASSGDSYASYYWYGGNDGTFREHEDGSVWVGVPMTYSREAPGVRVGYSWIHEYVYPVPMFVYEDPPMIEGRNYDGLLSYLERNARRLESWEIDRWGKGYEILENEIRVNVPYDTWVWLYTLEISTELSDTYVWKPYYADGEILNAQWASSGTDKATISTQDNLAVSVKNTGTVDGNLYVNYQASPAGILQIMDDGKLFTVGEEHTFETTAKNLGPNVKVDGEILIELVNDANDVRDTAKVYFTALPITGVTTLNVKLVEKGNPNKLLSGITVSVQYGLESATDISGNGWATFPLGAYQGPVVITAEESANYESKTETTTVSTGTNTRVIALARKGEGLSPWLIIGIVVAVVVVVIVVALKLRRR